MNLSRTKIRVNNAKESETIQRKAFALGWHWFTNGAKDVILTDSSYLFFSPSKYITHTTKDEPYFQSHEYREITLADLGITNGLTNGLSDLTHTRIRVYNVEESEAVQKKAFELGWRWEDEGQKITYTGCPFIYFNSGRPEKIISCGTVIGRFNRSNNREISLSDLGITLTKKTMPLTNLNKCKIRVRSAHESEVIQKKAFALGYKWSEEPSTETKYTDKPFLYFEPNNNLICYGTNETYFADKSYNEITLADLGGTLIGYKVKAGINEAAAFAAIGTTPSNKPRNGCDFTSNSVCEDRAKEYGLINILFEPVYKDEPNIIEIDYLTGKDNCGKGTLKLELIYGNNEEKIAKYNDQVYFTKKELEDVIMPINKRAKFAPVAFNIGCNGQFRNVSVEDIQKVINALK